MRIAFLTLIVCFCPLTFAGGPDPISSNVFLPDVIMGHQKEINLSDEQRENLIKVIQKHQPATVEPQFRLKAAADELNEILKQPHVDEEKAIAALVKLNKSEMEYKSMMIRLLVHIKNILTPEQQTKLRSLTQKEG